MVASKDHKEKSSAIRGRYRAHGPWPNPTRFPHAPTHLITCTLGQVGPLPTGAPCALSHRAVAFYAAEGTEEVRPLDSLTSLAGARQRALLRSKSNEGKKRVACAWVPLDSIRPFGVMPGSTHSDGSDGLSIDLDPALTLAIEAAELEAAPMNPPTNQGGTVPGNPNPGEIDPDPDPDAEDVSDDDSEGGWGVQAIGYRLRAARSKSNRTSSSNLDGPNDAIATPLGDPSLVINSNPGGGGGSSPTDLIPSAVGSRGSTGGSTGGSLESIMGWRFSPEEEEAAAQAGLPGINPRS